MKTVTLGNLSIAITWNGRSYSGVITGSCFAQSFQCFIPSRLREHDHEMIEDLLIFISETPCRSEAQSVFSVFSVFQCEIEEELASIDIDVTFEEENNVENILDISKIAAHLDPDHSKDILWYFNLLTDSFGIESITGDCLFKDAKQELIQSWPQLQDIIEDTANDLDLPGNIDYCNSGDTYCKTAVHIENSVYSNESTEISTYGDVVESIEGKIRNAMIEALIDRFLHKDIMRFANNDLYLVREIGKEQICVSIGVNAPKALRKIAFRDHMEFRSEMMYPHLVLALLNDVIIYCME